MPEERRPLIPPPVRSLESMLFPGKPIFPPGTKAEARNMLNKAGGHLSYADISLKTATEALMRLGKGYEWQIDEIKSIRDELYRLNERITDLIRSIY